MEGILSIEDVKIATIQQNDNIFQEGVCYFKQEFVVGVLRFCVNDDIEMPDLVALSGFECICAGVCMQVKQGNNVSHMELWKIAFDQVEKRECSTAQTKLSQRKGNHGKQYAQEQQHDARARWSYIVRCLVTKQFFYRKA